LIRYNRKCAGIIYCLDLKSKSPLQCASGLDLKFHNDYTHCLALLHFMLSKIGLSIVKGFDNNELVMGTTKVGAILNYRRRGGV